MSHSTTCTKQCQMTVSSLEVELSAGAAVELEIGAAGAGGVGCATGAAGTGVVGCATGAAGTGGEGCATGVTGGGSGAAGCSGSSVRRAALHTRPCRAAARAPAGRQPAVLLQCSASKASDAQQTMVSTQGE
eukprot:GHRQ01026705.1.p2 GENE.GHRQ01026705.1~~GHRQ01026705.1.p2  ORF type:complete len:132 (+),score=29.95 GHRQ01026705.1:485-880(+)